MIYLVSRYVEKKRISSQTFPTSTFRTDVAIRTLFIIKKMFVFLLLNTLRVGVPIFSNIEHNNATD